MFLAHAAIKRLVLGMRMNVDQSRQHQPILAVDHPIRSTGVIPPDKGDPVFGKSDIDPAAIDMAPGALVPGDDPIGILDDRYRHWRAASKS
jgi:hypothetical protein